MSNQRQLLVLGLGCGTNFPNLPGQQLQVRACLADNWLTSEDVVSALPDPQFNTELAWETSRDQLRVLRSRRAQVKLEVWMGGERMGHLGVGVRSAKPVEGEEGSLLTIHRLISQLSPAPSVELGLSLVKQETQQEDVVPREIKGGGYFEVGPAGGCGTKYSLSVCLEKVEQMEKVAVPSHLVGEQLYFHYQLLDTDISTEPLVSLDQLQFESERATARVHSNEGSIRQYLLTATLCVRLCCDSLVLAATAPTNLGAVLLTRDTESLGKELHYRGTLGLLCQHDKDQQLGKVVVSVTLTRLEESEENTGDITALSFGRLSESVMSCSSRQSSSSTEPQVTVTDLDHQEMPSKVVAAEITAMDCQPEVVDHNLTQCTEYQSPPRPKQPRLLDPAAPSSAVRQLKFSVELLTVLLPSHSCQDLVLVYKYLALHNKCITTQPGFSLHPSHLTPVPRGYCQFSFSVTQQKLEKTFADHPLKVGLYEAGQKVGVASVPLSRVLDSKVVRGTQTWRGQMDVMRTDGSNIGTVGLELQLLDSLAASRENSHNSHGAQTRHGVDETGGDIENKTDILRNAAREVEMWKVSQKQLFNQNLLQVETQHLDTLGKEWRNRELEREEMHSVKMEKLRMLEEELKKELKLVGDQRIEWEAKSKNLLEEKEVASKERSEAKEEKGLVISKLKYKLKETEAVVAAKNIELDALGKQLLSARSELAKKEEVKSAKRTKEEQEKTELMKLRAEKMTWQVGLEQVEKERQFYAENCRMLQTEVERLRHSQEQSYTEQIRRLEHQVRDLSSQILPVRDAVQIEHSQRLCEETKGGKETLTEDKETLAKLSPPIQSPDRDILSNIARLEENRSMLLRTGVYTESDYLLVQISRQIERLRSSPRSGEHMT